MAAECAKALLVIINIVFTIVGVGFIAGGIFIDAGEKHYKPQLQDFQDEIPNIASGIGLDVDEETNKKAQLDVGGILDTVKLILIVLGVFMVVVGVLGMFGACCAGKIKLILILYVIIVALLFIVKLAMIGYLYTSPRFENDVRKKLKDEIENKYGGIDDFSVTSLSLNYIMLDYECCGIDDYKDFNLADKWQKNRTLDIAGVEANYIMTIPIACCKTKGKIPKLEIKSENCTIDPSNEISNWKTGCWDKLREETVSNTIIIAGGFGGILALELSCVILAIYILCKEKNDNNYA